MAKSYNLNKKKISGIEISYEKEDLICYCYDSSGQEGPLPLAVAWPKNTSEVVNLVKYANDNDLFIIPRGSGTSTTGASIPLDNNTLVISFEKMKKLLEIDTANLNAVVEPGIINGRLQREVRSFGLFYPPDPASLDICTIGGNVATNAGGPKGLKYGVTRDYVMEIEAVLPDGSIIKVGGKTYKRAVGYDLKNLFIGSEGTLGIFTKLRLKLLPLPEESLTFLVSFKNLQASGKAVSKIISSSIIPSAIELIDKASIEAVENYKPIGLPIDVEALLIIELDGSPDTIKTDAEKVLSICNSYGADISLADDPLAKDKLWEARRAISPALYNIKPTKISEDIVVPRSKIPEMLTELKSLSELSGIQIASFGHAGDGNIHVNILVDKENQEEYLSGLNIAKKVFETTLKLGGSISGEHGIGITKAQYLNLEIKERELTIMKDIKRLYDPKEILNKGKIFNFI
ncbi:MAG: FAD-binding protein [Thermodesulfovibrionales bacterium]|nr:FAD-binding protein [Thermodesulfovibrionales bacterium]